MSLKRLEHGDREIGSVVKILVLLAALIAGIFLVGTGLGSYKSRAGAPTDLKSCNLYKLTCSGTNANKSSCINLKKKCSYLKPTPTKTPKKKYQPTPKTIPTSAPTPTKIIPPTPIYYPPTPTPSPTPTPTI